VEIARGLDVSRLTVSETLYEKRFLSPDMAIRLAQFLDTTSEIGFNMQQALNFWELQQEKSEEYRKILAFAA